MFRIVAGGQQARDRFRWKDESTLGRVLLDGEQNDLPLVEEDGGEMRFRVLARGQW